MTTSRMVTLGEVCGFIGGGTPSRKQPEFFQGDIPWATVKDFKRFLITDTEEHISEAAIASSATNVVEPGTVLLVSRVGLGKVAIAGCRLAINQDIKAIIPADGIEPEFLFWLLLSKAGDIQRMGAGATVKGITLNDIKSIKMPVPPISEQRRIVDLLSRAEGIVRLRHEAEKKAAELIPALFLDIFGDPATNPKGWPTRPLRELVTFMSGGTPSKAREDFWGGDLPWVSPKDMKRAAIADAIDHVSRKVLTETNLKLVPVGSLLIVVRGMILVHTVPVAVSGAPLTINQDMKALVLEADFNSVYLLWLMKVSQPQLLNLVATAAHGTKKLETERLEAFPIPLPPLEAQAAFANRIAQIESIQTQQAAATIKAQATFDALLSRVFTASHPQ
jgi:type I restriction enzyme S subunit